jgi:O-antigen/teichoic acid export membrane protein
MSMQTEEQHACKRPSPPSRWFRWLRRLAAYSGAQGIVLLVNALSGFLLVRGMSKEQYAWFTIANSLQATISVMSDSGLGSAMMAVGGRVSNDESKFVRVMKVAQQMRLEFMTLASVVVLPVGCWMLMRNNASFSMACAVSVLVALTGLAAGESAVLATMNKMRRNISLIIKADLSLGFVRLAAILAGLLSGLNAFIAVAATTVSQWVQVMVLRKNASLRREVVETAADDYKRQLRVVVRSLFPLCLFACVQGHLTTWILSFFAGASEVADVGALSRLGIIISFAALPVTQLIFPVISTEQNLSRVKRLTAVALVAVVLPAVSLCVLCVWFSEQVLWILGAQYAGLKLELAWFLVAQVIGSVATAIWSLAYARGWVRLAWIQIPLTLATQAVAAFCLNLSDVRQVIMFSSISNVIGIGVGGLLIWRGLQGLKNSGEAAQS